MHCVFYWLSPIKYATTGALDSEKKKKKKKRKRKKNQKTKQTDKQTGFRKKIRLKIKVLEFDGFYKKLKQLFMSINQSLTHHSFNIYIYIYIYIYGWVFTMLVSS